MPKVLTIAGVSILALGLVLGVALPSLAASDVPKPWAEDFQIRIVKGKVLSVDEEYQKYFKIQSGEEPLTIKVDGNTKYFKLSVPGRIVSLARHWIEFRHQNQQEIEAPDWHGMGLRHQNQISQPDDMDIPEPKSPKLKWLRPFGEEAEFSDIAAGDRVVVWLAEEGNGNLLAERVLIIKPTTYASVSGSITDVSSADKTITIAPEDGSQLVILDYNEGTLFILKGLIQVEKEKEQYAQAIYDSDNMIAKRVVVSSTGD
jgi:hypothetical protein